MEKDIIDILKEIQHIYNISGLPSSDPLSVPSLTVSATDGATKSVKYHVQRNDDITNPLITGYEVIRFGVPMIGEYVNAGVGRSVTISPAVTGAQYRITAWALLGEGRRSATPAVVYATTGKASEYRCEQQCLLSVSIQYIYSVILCRIVAPHYYGPVTTLRKLHINCYAMLYCR